MSPSLSDVLVVITCFPYKRCEGQCRSDDAAGSVGRIEFGSGRQFRELPGIGGSPTDVDVLVRNRDQELIEECLSGRVDAFGDLVGPYQDRLYNTLCRLVGHPEDAAELLQEALIRAFRGLKTYQGDASFYTWLYRITINTAFTSRRKQRLRTMSTEGLTDSGRLDLPDQTEQTRPSRNLELRERQELVQQALRSVPENYRAVLVLKDIEGLRYEEIAEILDIPLGTVRSRLHRARSEMRDRLKPLMDEGTL